MNETSKQDLFRLEYVKARSDDVMGTMSVNPSRAIKIAAIASIVTSIALVVTLSKLPYTRTVTMLGLLSRNSTTFVVQSSLNEPAQILDVLISEGSKIHPGTELLRLRSPERELSKESAMQGNFLLVRREATEFSEEHLLLISIKAGEVTNILVAPGQHVAPEQPLLMAVQQRQGMYVTTYVPSRALRGFVEGKEVGIRLDAFPQQQYGMLRGVVEKVWATSLTPYQVAEKLGTSPPPEPMFRVDISIPENQKLLKRAGGSIRSGMKVELDAPMESGTLLNWLLRRGKS